MIFPSFLYYLSWSLPFLGALTLVALLARLTASRRPPDTLEDVAMLLRQMDVIQLAALLDPSVPLTMRKSLSDDAYRRELGLHIRIVREYLQRLHHNVRILNDWLVQESALAVAKSAGKFTPRELLVGEALQIATTLRKRMLLVNFKLWIWSVLHLHRWPIRFLPSIPNLRVLSGVNLLASYGRLSEITRALSIQQGSYHQSGIFEAL